MKKETIIQKAEAFCKEHQVDQFPVNIVSICNRLNISVFERPLPSGVSGFIVIQEEPFKNFETGRLIMVNSSDSAARKRFTIAHELAHYVLHKKEGEPIYAHRDAGQHGGIETEANIFASNLLMPKALVKKYLSIFDDCTNRFRVEQLALASAVSNEAAHIRLDQLGLMGG